jgi:hypothetical protein
MNSPTVRGPADFSGSDGPHIRFHQCDSTGAVAATCCFGASLPGVNTPTVLCQAPAVAFSTWRVPFFTDCQGDGEVFVDCGFVQAFFAGGGVAVFAAVELAHGMLGALHVDGCISDLLPVLAVVAGVA